MLSYIRNLFEKPIELRNNFILLQDQANEKNQFLTNEAFSDKWIQAEKEQSWKGKALDFQREWYLSLYGFKSEKDLGNFLSNKQVVLDAGCGLGYKAAMFAELSPSTIVIAMDFSESAFIAKEHYKKLDNLFFIKGDIAKTGLKASSIDYVSCDQVIHHTSNPSNTFQHLSERIKPGGEFACYVYAKKALPRELIDDYFRENIQNYTQDEIWELSKQLTMLGKTLSELNTSIKIPNLPILGIQGGEYDVQRFIYWNFLKCFWNEELGEDYSISTNYDWYSPKNAFRFSKEEFKKMADDNGLETIYFHQEQACFSGRFKKN